MTAPPLAPGAEEARLWARDELSEQVYRQAEPGLLERAVTWLLERLAEIELPAEPAPRFALVVALLVIAGLLVAAVALAGPVRLRRRARASGAVFDELGGSAGAHRAAADEHAAAGRWADAVRERFRAVARSLEERAVLVATPGRTADELARDAGVVLPSVAGELAAAAAIFDDVWYGGRPATADHDARLRDVDAAVAAARPAAEPAAEPVP